jgi:hypothetical protein
MLVDKEKHAHIRNFLLIISFPLLMIIPTSLILEQTNCEIVLNYTNEKFMYGNNFTMADGVTPTYHWDYGDAPQFSSVELDNPETVFLFHHNTTYTYGEVCVTNSNGSRGFFRAFTVILIVFLTYVFIMFAGDILNSLKNAVRRV